MFGCTISNYLNYHLVVNSIIVYERLVKKLILNYSKKSYSSSEMIAFNINYLDVVIAHNSNRRNLN